MGYRITHPTSRISNVVVLVQEVSLMQCVLVSLDSRWANYSSKRSLSLAHQIGDFVYHRRFLPWCGNVRYGYILSSRHTHQSFSRNMAIEYLAALPQMMPPPNVKVLIAGACGGLGFALTEAALAASIEVVGLDRQEDLREIALPVSTHGIACDATNEDSVAFAAVSNIWLQIDHVVNFVGLTKERVLLEDLAMAEWDEIVDGCLKSAFLIARRAAPLLRRGKNPTLVNTSSTFGAAIRHDGYCPYATTKAAVINLTKALALEWAPNIRVNAIAPRIINTAFLRGGTGRPAKPIGVDQAAVLASIPLQRLGEASDITGLALFLSSPAVGFITGQTVHANGGTWS